MKRGTYLFSIWWDNRLLFVFNNFVHLDRTGWSNKYCSENTSEIFPCYNRKGASFNSNYYL